MLPGSNKGAATSGSNQKAGLQQEKFPLPPAPLSNVCHGWEWEGDALAEAVQLKLLGPGQVGVTPAWLVLLAEGSAML